MANSYYNPAPGPQRPELYPFVGAGYLKHGEQVGWRYDPWSDRYKPDPNAQQQLAQSQGLIPPTPKQPSLADMIIPGAAIIGTGTLASEAGKGIGGFFTGGGTAATGATQATGALAGGAAAPSALGAGAAGAASGAASGAGTSALAAPNVVGASRVPVAAAGGESAGMFSLGGIGSAGNAILPAIGAVGAYDVLANDRGSVRGSLEGAASGAALGSYFGPQGAAIGAGIGLGVGFIKSLFADDDKWKTEKNRLSKLTEKGVFVPPQILNSMPSKGRSKDELIRHDLPPDFVGNTPDGGWVNNKFANTRDEKDLRGEDIVGYATFAEQDPEWFKRPLAENVAYANQLLQAGLVNEHHGTIEVDWKKAPPRGSAAAPAPVPVPAPATAKGAAPLPMQSGMPPLQQPLQSNGMMSGARR